MIAAGCIMYLCPCNSSRETMHLPYYDKGLQLYKEIIRSGIVWFAEREACTIKIGCSILIYKLGEFISSYFKAGPIIISDAP